MFVGFNSEQVHVQSIPNLRVILRALENPKSLGYGSNAEVFEIPGTKFVIRVPHTSKKETLTNEPELVQDIYPHHNFGQQVGKIGNIQILKRQYGIPAGLTNSKAVAQADSRYAFTVQLAADMPQSAYNKLAEELAYLNSIEGKGAQFDPSKSNNLLIDAENQRFNLVDINEGHYKSGLESMLVVLMGNTYAWKYRGESLQCAYTTIFNKAEHAANKVGLSLELGSSGLYSKELASSTEVEL